jgi:hypothetical protein
MRLPHAYIFLAMAALISPDVVTCKGGGGGASSGGGGGGRGGGSSSGSRGSSGGSSKGSSGSTGGSARPVPSVPKWSSAKNGFRGGGQVLHRSPVAAPLVGFYLGYLLTGGMNDASTIVTAGQCEGCRHIRDGVKTCLNVDITPLASPNETLTFATDPELDSECFCSQLAPEIYDKCFQCAPSIPVDVKTESFRLRDECSGYLTSGTNRRQSFGYFTAFALSAAGTLFWLV